MFLCVPGPEHGHAQEAKDGIFDPRKGHIVAVLVQAS